MINRKITLYIILGTFLFSFLGCSSSKVSVEQGGFYHSGIYFGKNFPLNYQKGIIDGCTTAKGDYSKDHQLFNENNNYNNGWFLGRNRCKSLLIIEKDIDKNKKENR